MTNWEDDLLDDPADSLDAAAGMVFGLAIGAIAWLLVGLVVWIVRTA